MKYSYLSDYISTILKMYRPFRSKFLYVIPFLISLVAILLFSNPVFSEAIRLRTTLPLQEIRGVWLTNVDSEVMFSRAGIRNTFNQLTQLKFNTVYPVVWNWGYTQYPSAIAQQTYGLAVDPRSPGLQNRDALAEMVEIGHRRGLAIVPWFEFGFMTTAESEMASRHPNWITQRRDGSQIWQEGIYQRKWLNPFQPEVQQFIQNLVLEIVTQYNIDGIQFDDHFGLPHEFGYDEYTVQLYRQEHQGNLPPSNAEDPEWIKWRANKITAFMRQLFRAIKDQKEEVVVSLSPNRYDFALNKHLQDWRTWEREGLVEELVVQVYTSSVTGLINELARPEVQEARRHIPTGVGILTGLKDRPVAIRQVQEQVEAVRRQGFAGVSFFFYETMWNLSDESISDRQSVFRSLFSRSALRPILAKKPHAQS
ncbi:MAG: glycoside hydrolase family 10 protein [Timaviella obliquedivisa GSE-PSE-MK23-08B]|nr:glycoside hydrolase family 10 protein [Timaviella obliquedivisa GSE-PSE-MK23-08B]